MKSVLFPLVLVSVLILGCPNNNNEGSSSSSEGEENLSSGGSGGSSPSSGGSSSSNGTSTSSSSVIQAMSYSQLTASNATSGYATRYWDGCKPSCSWPENVNSLSNICRNCDKDSKENEAYYWHKEWNKNAGTLNSCNDNGPAYTCFDMAPVKINDNLAYGFVATAGAEGNVCGKCYQLQFDGKGKHDTKPAHGRLVGKTMIVMASNIGYDVGSGHFDILIPGGGLGNFDSFSGQLGITSDKLGARSGGFLTTCQEQLGWDADHKTCVKQKCTEVFGGNSKFAELLRGCEWFVDWFEAADNPTFLYKEITCPNYLSDKYRSNK